MRGGGGPASEPCVVVGPLLGPPPWRVLPLRCVRDVFGSELSGVASRHGGLASLSRFFDLLDVLSRIVLENVGVAQHPDRLKASTHSFPVEPPATLLPRDCVCVCRSFSSLTLE